MRGVVLNKEQIYLLEGLRKAGNSLNKIVEATGLGRATVFKYIRSVEIPDDLRDSLKFGSRKLAESEWATSKEMAETLIQSFEKRDRIILLAALYWGEGTKKELNFINSDPEMIRVFVECLQDLGVDKSDLIVSLRLYEDIDKEEAVNYWSNVIKLPSSQVASVNVINGKKTGKLKFGMCRVRVRKGARHFKMIISLINAIKKKI